MKNTFFLHLFFFCSTVVFISFYLFYQVFVTSGYQKIPVRTFLRPHTLLNAIKTLKDHTVPYHTDRIYLSKNGIVEQEKTGPIGVNIQPNAVSSVFIVDEQKYLTEINKNTLQVTDLMTKKSDSFSLPENATYSVIGFINADTLVLSAHSTHYSLFSLSRSSKKIEVLQERINFPGNVLTRYFGETLKTIVYPDCTPQCYLVFFDLVDHKELHRLPAFTDPGHAPSLTSLEVLFFDPATGVVGYQVTERGEAYVIDTQLNLLQLIRLENDRNSAQYIGYIPFTQQLLFSLNEKQKDTVQLVLYHASKPSLHHLGIYKQNEPITLSPAAGLYSANGMIYSLTGEALFSLEQKQLIPAY